MHIHQYWRGRWKNENLCSFGLERLFKCFSTLFPMIIVAVLFVLFKKLLLKIKFGI